MKKCTICKEIKPYNQFYKNKLTKDGYGSQCKSCDTKERRRLTYEKKRYLVNLFGGKENYHNMIFKVKDLLYS